MRSFVSLLLCASLAFPPAVLAAPASAMQGSTLEDGTPVKLRLSRTMSSADARTGEQVDFEVLEDVRVGELNVIPKGGIAMGTVTEAEAKKRMGRGGKLNMTIDYVRLASGERAALRAVKEGQGGGSTGAMTAGIVAASLIVWPAAPFFLFMKGKDITIPKGTEITAYINGNFEINPAKFGGKAVSGATPTSAAAREDAGSASSILISSTPAGAEIEIDGNFVGSTPSMINLEPGDRLITIKKRGFNTWERRMRVSQGNLKVEVDLEPIK